MEDSPYRQFSFFWIWRRFLEPIPGYSILGIQNASGTGDPKTRVLPGAWRKMIPYFSISSSISGNNLCTQVIKSTEVAHYQQEESGDLMISSGGSRARRLNTSKPEEPRVGGGSGDSQARDGDGREWSEDCCSVGTVEGMAKQAERPMDLKRALDQYKIVILEEAKNQGDPPHSFEDEPAIPPASEMDVDSFVKP
ncbi:hypothetical protein F2Q70_00038634 [Brassica cretica]|uniref:Uncharacterized protein n=1 Tax=Brassica cretica TaxID=69181 RepID=A0A8S9KCG4_BRACR|nr:hypothetical protein F2Q70_00038634 [Brassica cretica]